MLSRTFATRAIVAISLAFATACGDDDNEGENNNNACPPGQVREGNRCVTPGNGNNNNTNNNENADNPGCTDTDAANYDSSADADDGSCVYAVTFSVDMTGFDTAAGVSVSASNGETYPLTDSGSDDIWTGVGNIASGNYFFRFVRGTDPEDIPLACNDNPGGTFTERGLTVSDAPTSTPVYPFSECIPLEGPLTVDTYWFASGYIGDGGTAGNVTDDTTGCPTRAGDQLGSCHAMTYNVSSEGFAGIFWQFPDGNFTNGDDGRRVETTLDTLTFWAWSDSGGETVEFIAGSDIDDFKVSTGNSITLTSTPTEYTIEFTTSSGLLVTPFSWVIADTPNSGNSYTFYIDDIALSSETMVSIPGCTDSDANNFDDTATVDDGSCTYDLTLQVDMSQETFNASDGVFATGSFGADVQLTDGDMDDIYSGTVSVAPGSYTYSFYVGSTPPMSEIVPSTCDAGGGARQVNVGPAPVELAAVLFGGCPSDVLGCTDPDAANFNASATTDDGSCVYTVSFAVDVNIAVTTGVQVALSDGTTVDLADGNGDDVWTGTADRAPGSYFYRFLVDGTPEVVPLACNDNPSGTFNERGFTIVDAPVGLPTTPLNDCVPLSAPIVVDDNWFASGFIGDGETPGNVTQTLASCPTRAGDELGNCYSVSYTEAGLGFAGVLWNFPDGNLTDLTQGIRVDNTPNVVRFWAWGENGGEVVKFVTGIGALDTFNVEREFTLTTTPTEFTLFIGGETWDKVVGPFGWVAALTGGATIEFYIDDITWENATVGCTDSNAKNYDVNAVADDGSCTYDLTFSVDMSCPDALDGSNNSIGEFTGFTDVRIAGPFNGFAPNITLVDSGSGNIWTITLTDLNLPNGQFEYFYLTDNYSSKENLLDEVGTCGLPLNTDGTNFANRVITAINGQTYNDLYGQCATDCPIPTTELNEALDSGPADGLVFQDGGNSFVGDIAGAISPVGYIGATNNAFVFGFQLPSSLRQDDVVSDAAIRLRFFALPENVPDFGADLVGLGTRDDPEILATDYDGSTTGTLIQADFLSGGTYTQGDLITTDGAGSTALVDFLNAQLQTAGTTPGDWVFFRLAPNGANGTGGNAFWQVNTGNEGLPEAPPLLTFTSDCTTCDSFALGCTASNANNYDPTAIVDDGSCIYDVTFTVDMGCPDPDDAFSSVQITGPFCSFCGDINMADQGGGIWSITLAVQEGAFEHKFITDGFSSEEDLIDDMVGGASCAPRTDFSSFANRQVAVDRNNLAFGAVYGQCASSCFEVGLVTYAADSADARILANGGSPLVQNAVGPESLEIGDISAEPSVMVIPVQIPTVSMGGFTEGDFDARLISIVNSPSWNVDLYGLPFRTAADVLAGDYFAGADDATSGVVKIADDFITASTAPGSVRTPESASATLIGYINDQITAGAVAGDYLFFRLNPDDTNVGGAIVNVFSADNPAEFPRLRLK